MKSIRSHFGGLTFGDLAAVSQLTTGAVQHLDQLGYIPRGSPVRAAKRAAVIGGFAAAGAPPAASGALADAVAAQFNQSDGEAFSGISVMVCEVNRSEASQLFYGRAVDSDELRDHGLLYYQWPEYPRGMAMPADAIVEVVDRAHVFLGQVEPSLHVVAADPDGYEHIAIIRSWTRALAVIDLPAIQRPPEWIASLRRNAVGKIVINVSLAIRNGFDRLAERRGKGASS